MICGALQQENILKQEKEALENEVIVPFLYPKENIKRVNESHSLMYASLSNNTQMAAIRKEKEADMKEWSIGDEAEPDNTEEEHCPDDQITTLSLLRG